MFGFDILIPEIDGTNKFRRFNIVYSDEKTSKAIKHGFSESTKI